MGKENLLYRPGRASGEKIVATPDAQLLGELSFTFGLHIQTSGFDEANVARAAREYLTPISSYQQCDFLNGRLIFAFRDEERVLDTDYSLMSFSDDSNVVLSSFKKAEQSEGYIVRVFNPYLAQSANVNIHFNQPVHAERVSLGEQPLEPQQRLTDGEKVVRLPELEHCKLMTVLVSI